jgi:hypothetical protein
MFTRDRVGFCAACRRGIDAHHRPVLEMIATAGSEKQWSADDRAGPPK